MLSKEMVVHELVVLNRFMVVFHYRRMENVGLNINNTSYKITITWDSISSYLKNDLNEILRYLP